MLDHIEGFMSVERFQSLTDPRKILSLSFFEDEEAIARWRNLTAHRGAQDKGRNGIFDDYRLRIASVIRDCMSHQLADKAIKVELMKSRQSRFRQQLHGWRETAHR